MYEEHEQFIKKHRVWMSLLQRSEAFREPLEIIAKIDDIKLIHELANKALEDDREKYRNIEEDHD